MIRCRTLLILVSVLSVGCGITSKQEAFKVLMVDGCMVEIEGVVAEKGQTKVWNMGDDCKLTIDSDQVEK